MRLGLIVQRYGEGVDGGAEVHCRSVAERLAARHQVTVLTTCAQDYLSWANHFPPGAGELNGVEVLRFPVARRRRVRLFNFLAKRLYTQKHTIDAEWRWLVRQGPYVPEFINHLLANSGKYDALIFWTYLYFPTAAGLPLVSRKSILVPTAHDETPLYLSLFRPVFHLPRYILFNTEAERDLVHRVFNNQQVPHQVVGLGIDPPAQGDPQGFRERHGLEEPFLLYLGRIDVMKGADELFAHFARLAKEPEFSGLKLVLVGKERMEIPRHPAMKSLGFVSEEDKASALRAATALVTPSPYESLSMVTMEAGLCGKPVLVSKDCEVLARHVAESGAGLAYKGYDGFKQAVGRILGNPAEARAMGQKGREFVSQRFSWGPVLEIYEQVISEVAGQARQG